jgi:pyrimidine-nucleoside phosphorylase
MGTIEIIEKKKNGEELTYNELKYIVEGYVRGDIPDYQMSAFLMSVFFAGMTKKETADMTKVMAESGDKLDLSEIKGIKVDKHSTGGIGDKTSLIVGPIAAACGLKIAKMSGRGLGYTGGTIDKLESIPGFRTDIDRSEFIKNVKDVGLSIIGQTDSLCPADKKIYSLRDVTATVNSIPLIASSIMSKKLIDGSDRILLDVKCGNGAFMKTLDEARMLAEEMVDIGENIGKHTVAMITDMNKPLGRNIGNSLEVIEALDVLDGKGPKDLKELCLTMAANMIVLGKKADSMDIAMIMAEGAIDDGSAKRKFAEMVKAQGGDQTYVYDTTKFKLSDKVIKVTSPDSGFIVSTNAEEIGRASVMLGAGREKKDSVIDPGAGIIMKKSFGEKVEKGEIIAEVYSSGIEKCQNAEVMLQKAIKIGAEKPAPCKLIYERIEHIR